MQSIINFKWFSSCVIILLILALCVPSISFAVDSGDYSGSGGGSGESSAESEADKEAAKEAAEAEQAAQDAAEVSAAAAAAGVSVSVSAVRTAGPATPGNVSVNGVSMSKEAALGAIGAIGSATSNGAKSAESVGISVEGTFAGYANGSLSAGQVSGINTGYKGTPSEVAAQERAYALAVGVSSLANTPTQVNSLPSSVAALSDEAFDARFNATPASTPTIDARTVSVAPDLRGALAQAAAATGELTRR